MITSSEILRIFTQKGIAAAFLLLFTFFSTPLFADIRGTDINGRPVILRSDGTWSYVQQNSKAQACQKYSNNAVSQQRANLARNCGYAGGRWHQNYNTHYNWCMRVNAQSRNSEQKARRDALNRCGTTNNKAQACQKYSNNAVSQQRANLARNCGYTGGRWHQNYNTHYNWCMRVNAQSRNSEHKVRRDALNRCGTTNNKAQACQKYSNNAVSQQRANLARNCGFSGARWHQNFNVHYNWCMRVNAQNRSSEQTARRNALQRCSGTNTGGQTRYLGCFVDRNDRDLKGFFISDGQMTNRRCINMCRNRGFRFAGTQYYSQCFCGNTYGRYGRAATARECNAPCRGNSNETCGGTWRNSVYQLR